MLHALFFKEDMNLPQHASENLSGFFFYKKDPERCVLLTESKDPSKVHFNLLFAYLAIILCLIMTQCSTLCKDFCLRYIFKYIPTDICVQLFFSLSLRFCTVKLWTFRYLLLWFSVVSGLPGVDLISYHWCWYFTVSVSLP